MATGLGGEEELVERLIEKTRRHLEERTRRLREALRKAPRVLELLDKEGLLHRVEPSPPGHGVAGLDGSRQVLRIGLGRYLVIAVTALVHIPGGAGSTGARLYYPLAEVYEVHDPSGTSIEAAAEAAMLLLETLALGSAAHTGAETLMLDGPLIDPPAPIDESVWGLLRAEILQGLSKPVDYHAMRAKSLRRLVEESGVQVIGVVKRVSGSTLISRAVPAAPTALRGLGDDDLLAVLGHVIRDKRVAIGPFEPQLPSNILASYRAEDSRIITYYTYSPWTGKPLRVETIASLDRDEARVVEETASMVAGMTPPGHNYPLPVQLAHEKSHLSRRLARLIYNEALASLLGDEEAIVIASRLVEEQ